MINTNATRAARRTSATQLMTFAAKGENMAQKQEQKAVFTEAETIRAELAKLAQERKAAQDSRTASATKAQERGAAPWDMRAVRVSLSVDSETAAKLLHAAFGEAATNNDAAALGDLCSAALLPKLSEKAESIGAALGVQF